MSSTPPRLPRQWPPPRSSRGATAAAGHEPVAAAEEDAVTEAEAELSAAMAGAGPGAAPEGPGEREATPGDEELTKLAAERDDYLDRLRRLQAEFENYKKRIVKQQLEQRERAAEDLVTQLLPVLDTFDLALAHGAVGLDPVHRSMLDVLGGVGLERLDPAGQTFDPNEHDAVQHEADDGGREPEVLEVLRAGYRWKGRVLRPAMVKVKG